MIAKFCVNVSLSPSLPPHTHTHARTHTKNSYEFNNSKFYIARHTCKQPYMCITDIFLHYVYVRYCQQNMYVQKILVSLDSIVSIVTCYRLDHVWITSHWGQHFLHLSWLATGANDASYTMVLGHSWRWISWDVALTTHPHLEPRLKKE